MEWGDCSLELSCLISFGLAWRGNEVDECIQLQVLKVDLQDGVYAVHWKNVHVIVYLPTARKVLE